MSVLCFVFYKELLNSLTYGIAAITLGIDKALLQMYKAVSQRESDLPRPHLKTGIKIPPPDF